MGANPNNIGGQIVAVQATANASATSAQTGSAIDRIGFASGKLVISRGAATGSPSSQTTDAKLQHSDTTTSGDFVDYFAIDPQRAGCYIADVSGHGVASAFVTVWLKRFMATALEAQRQGQPSAIGDPAQLLAQLNAELLRERLGKHIAIWYGVFDLARQNLLCANAGAVPYPLLADASGTRFLEARSTPAGLFDTSDYQNQTHPLAAQFRLLLCSDGVLEVMPESSGSGRNRRLLDLLAPDCAGLDALLTRLGIHPEDPHPDDLTLLLIGRDAAG